MANGDRYSRQTRFAALGEAGQRRLQQATAAIVGCGALGAVQAELLARAGVGRLILIDRDFVELSNLQRQTLYDEADAAGGLPKTVAAKRRLSRINSEVRIEDYTADLHAGNIDELLASADLFLDATDNFETRFLLNDYAVRENKPWLYGAAVASYGIAMPVLPGRGACLRCIYPEPPGGLQPTCETAGVLNAITSLIASLQAACALQILSGNAAAVRLKITTADVWNGPLRERDQPERDPACPCCGRRDFIFLEHSKRAPISLCGRNAVQIHERARPLDLDQLATRLSGMGAVRKNEFAVRLFADPYEITVFPDGRAIIKGTTDPGVARSLYSRLIGN